MRKRKRTKTIDDVAVSKLLDDFVDLDIKDDSKRETDMNDEEYVSMMLKKDAMRKIERLKKEPVSIQYEEKASVSEDLKAVFESCQSCFYCANVKLLGDHIICACTNAERELEARYARFKWWVISQPNPSCWTSPPCDAIDDILRQHVEPDSEQEQVEEPAKSEMSQEEETAVQEVVESHDVEDAVEEEGMKIAVDFLQEELGQSMLKQKAKETLKKYRKEKPIKKKKKSESPVVSEKLSTVKRCQNCYFCAGQKKIGGSCWCHCTNPGRSSDVKSDKSWVKSRLNLSCWKPPQE
ncbi:MAG: hypothetical protein RTV72_09980 [Candidatus Thorarchaeota archaeon]